MLSNTHFTSNHILTFSCCLFYTCSISADPGLCQGRGGAWDHWRCGTWLSGRKQRHTPFQGNNSVSYMPLPSVFHGVQDCRLPGFKPSKRRSRHPRQQLLQLHAPAICFSGGSRLPLARPQTLQTLHRPFQGKTAVCPASNPPNAAAGLSKATTLSATFPSHLHAPAICFSRGSRLPFARLQTLETPQQALPRQHLFQLHAPAICFSRGSRLLFAQLQTLRTLLQASKATTLTATCPFLSVFQGFKTAVCPASNAPNPSAGLQGTNSYSYMPLPSVFQGVQDCRLPGFKRSKPFRRPPRHQLLQLHAFAICFSGGSRLPFARLQTRQTLLQASKATTLTATCPFLSVFQGFKTAVCPASNAPNPSAGLQGNNSYSYMPPPSVFQGVQDCRLPGFKRSKPFRRPPRHQLLQLHAFAICFSGGSRLPFARLCRLPGFKRSAFPRQQLLQLHAPAICFSGVSRLPFARLQTRQTLPQASKATTLTATTCPGHLFFTGFKTALCPASNLPNASAGFSKATTLTATCLCHLFFTGFKPAVCPASNPPNPSAGLQGNNSYSYMPLPPVFQGVQGCRLPGFKPAKPFRRPPRQQLLQLHAPAICGFKRSKPFRRPPRQQLLLLHAPAICFSGGSRLPFAWLQTLQTLPQASKAPTLTATCPCHLFFRGFKTAVCPASNAPNPSAGLQGNNSYSYMPLPICFSRVQDCRLPGFKRSKPFRRPPRQQLLQLHAPAICFSGGSRLPFARLQTLQTLPQASKATTLTATCPCHLFSGGSRLPFARLQTLLTLPQASKATTLTAPCPCHLFFRGFKTAVCLASNAPSPSAGLQGNNSYSYMPLPTVFHPQTLPQASKATTLTATCLCHLFFTGFKTAVCPASNPPNASARFSKATTLTATCPCHLFFILKPFRGLQGNNSYSYMPLPSVFHGVQDCRLPGFAVCPASNPQAFPRQQLLQLLHAFAICFSGGSRLPVCQPSNP